MAWIYEGEALTSSKAPSGVSTTSTSTIRVAAQWQPGVAQHHVGATGLRMYGVDHNQVEIATKSKPDQVVVGDGSEWTRFEAEEFEAEEDVPQTIEWLETNDAAQPFDLTTIYLTAVPKRKLARTWPYVSLSKGGSKDVSDKTFDVIYKDVCLVELPDGSWLMIVGRYRMTAGEDQGPSPTNSLGDIVAWVSPDPDFAGEQVVGPFLLVDSLDALTGGYVRVWLGVPGGVVDPEREELLVYYVVEENGRSDNAPPKFDEYDDLNEYQDVLTEFGFRRGIYLKRFALSALADRLADEVSDFGRYTDESGTLYPYFQDLAVPGTLEGRVEVVVAESTGSLSSTPFEEVYDGGGDEGGVPLVADPRPVWSSAGRLTLYFAAIGGGVGFDQETHVHSQSGHGIWRASAALGSAGTQFVVAPTEDGSGRSSDHITPISLIEPVLFLDPDPVELEDGSWLLFVGQASVDPAPDKDKDKDKDKGPGEPPPESPPLLRFKGDSTDGDPKSALFYHKKTGWALPDFTTIDSFRLDRGIEINPTTWGTVFDLGPIWQNWSVPRPSMGWTRMSIPGWRST